MKKYLETLQEQTFTIYTSPYFDMTAIVANLDPDAPASTELLVEAYYRLKMAHIPHESVFIFYVADVADMGAPLVNKAPNTPLLYHILPENFLRLESFVGADKPFLVNDAAAEKMGGIHKLSENIYSLPQKLANGKLMVVGIPEIHV